MRKDPDGFDPDEEEEKWCGTVSGLSVVNAEGAPIEYRLEVQEDAVWEAAQGPKTTYKAADTSKPTGPKMESCSCIEGNPCADAYCCKDCASSRLCNLARTHAPVPCPSHARPCPSTLAFPQRPARARARLWGLWWLSCHALHRNGLRRAKPIWLLSPRREEPIRGGQEEWVEGILISAHARTLLRLITAGCAKETRETARRETYTWQLHFAIATVCRVNCYVSVTTVQLRRKT